MNAVDEKRLAEIDLLAAESRLAYLRYILKESGPQDDYPSAATRKAAQDVAQQEFEVERCEICLRQVLSSKCPHSDCGLKAGHEGKHISARMD